MRAFAVWTAVERVPGRAEPSTAITQRLNGGSRAGRTRVRRTIIKKPARRQSGRDRI